MMRIEIFSIFEHFSIAFFKRIYYIAKLSVVLTKKNAHADVLVYKSQSSMTRRNVQPTLRGLGIFGVKSSLLCYQDYFFSKLNRFFLKLHNGAVERCTKRGFCVPVLPDRIAPSVLWSLHLTPSSF
jgi:hypothetical protein